MATVKDPVCGMNIEVEKASASTTQDGKTYYFCSPMCKTKFTQNPAKYVKESDPAHHDHQHH